MYCTQSTALETEDSLMIGMAGGRANSYRNMKLMVGYVTFLANISQVLFQLLNETVSTGLPLDFTHS